MSSQFSEYALRRRRFWLSFTGCVALAVAALVLLGAGAYFRIQERPWAGFVVTVLGAMLATWLVRIGIAWYRLLSWSCPGCNKSFALAWWSSWPTDQCKHCGLKVERS